MINSLNNLSEEMLGRYVVANVEEKVAFKYVRSYSLTCYSYLTKYKQNNS